MLSPVAENGISLFMKKLNMGYAKYFNERYKRTGALFQGKYKAIRVISDAHYLYLPLYIHLNPLDLTEPTWRSGALRNVDDALHYLESYRWSSHLDYLGKHNFPSITDRTFFEREFGGPSGYAKTFRTYLDQFDIGKLQGMKLEL